jgi:predicted transcriptional regulator
LWQFVGMSKTGGSSGETSESVRISSEIKRKLQEYSRQQQRPLRRELDKAVEIYLREWTGKE